jgi:hypothetical protein
MNREPNGAEPNFSEDDIQRDWSPWRFRRTRPGKDDAAARERHQNTSIQVTRDWSKTSHHGGQPKRTACCRCRRDDRRQASCRYGMLVTVLASGGHFGRCRSGRKIETATFITRFSLGSVPLLTPLSPNQSSQGRHDRFTTFLRQHAGKSR